MKTAIERASEAIEAAQKMFVDEMGATLELSPAAKMALIVKIAGAIRAAVAEERRRVVSKKAAPGSGTKRRQVALSPGSSGPAAPICLKLYPS